MSACNNRFPFLTIYENLHVHQNPFSQLKGLILFFPHTKER